MPILSFSEALSDEFSENEHTSSQLLDDEILNIGDYVLVKFNFKEMDIFYVEVIFCKVSQKEFEVKFMRMRMTNLLSP